MWGNRFTRWLYSQALYGGGGFARTAFWQLPLLAVYLSLACSEMAVALAVRLVVRVWGRLRRAYNSATGKGRQQ